MTTVSVIGKASDGTRILKQVAKPTHFTAAQAKAAIRKVKRARLLALDMLVSGITEQNRHGDA